MNIITTGHKGLIGSFLKKRLEEEGHKIVFAIDKKEGNNILSLANRKIDFNCDLLVHMAAHCKINESITNPEETFENNVIGTYSVFEFCRKNKIPKIIYFSSSRVLNKEKNPYTASKLFGEELCKSYKSLYGIDYLIIRPSTVYGPIWDHTKRLMHIFVTRALAGEDLEIFGNPNIKTLDFTYVDDFVDGIMIAMKNKWCEDYNISGDEEFKVYDLAKKIIELTNSKSKIIIKNPEAEQPQEVSVDISKLAKLGYSPKVKLIDGVERTVNFYKSFVSENN
ncbi:MAG: NAD(P)-dependent oxidoreductase [Nanoarchaeota archaeon]|nr:NAD(P)-dependent oxidoreductase [Nanoarchaeota archaeon]